MDGIIPNQMITPGRKITGFSAIFLPYNEIGQIDWDGFLNHLVRTVKAGLVPAVNMDTGHVNYLTFSEQDQVLKLTQEIMGGKPFASGVFIGDKSQDDWNPALYRQRIEKTVSFGAIPVIMQSFGLQKLEEEKIPDAYLEITHDIQQYIAFELGRQFAPFGRIYSLETYGKIMRFPNCIGAKHSSLSRLLEWQRLRLRNEQRPEFKVFTGNDLAIDMVIYGSDYLLGLSTFAPDLFALRDRFWEYNDPLFYELNDLLQYLGWFAFRHPTPAYKHNAAQMLKLQGWICSDAQPPGSSLRPSTDEPILYEILTQMEQWRRDTR